MKQILLAAVAAALLTPAAASAEERLTATAYLRATTCVTYAQAPQLSGDGADYSRLQNAIQAGAPEVSVVQRARQSANAARRVIRRAGDSDAAVADLRRRRTEACEPFESQQLVQLPQAGS